VWAKLDDALLDHPKLLKSGVEIRVASTNNKLSKDADLVALGFYTACILYVNRHLTDGFLTFESIERLPGNNPKQLAVSLAKAGLLDSTQNGYRIHDYLEHNPTAESVRKKRAEDRARKRNAA
jgi:hypothetical protein